MYRWPFTIAEPGLLRPKGIGARLMFQVLAAGSYSHVVLVSPGDGASLHLSRELRPEDQVIRIEAQPWSGVRYIELFVDSDLLARIDAPPYRASWQLAERGHEVVIHEMRPVRQTQAHKTERLAELVCSNTFKSTETSNAHGLLKAEMRLLGSMILECADASRDGTDRGA